MARWATAGIALLVGVGLVGCGEGEDELPRGVSLSRSDAMDVVRDLENEHRIDDIEAVLVTWDEFRQAARRADLYGQDHHGEAPTQGGLEANYVWVVGAHGDFFAAGGQEYVAVMYVLDSRSGKVLVFEPSGSHRIPEVLRTLRAGDG
jgi:hypothetical protein